ncbi:85/88 kDa calcium-independent phospholipase A2-like isoform X2 [Bolinopsis microptera]|uniref:85/88 kDa calcium-independent phospholipase A2-like isoform X2 n=1 Tax=Bolinopsis microptera TaxID=2820187 RepID=UPI003079DE5E
MFNKFSDGLSGLKTYVNSPALGRNQVPLHIAVKSNTAFAVNQLLNAGGDPLAKDEAGNNPVHAAAFSGCYIALEAILAHETVNRNGIKEDVLASTNNEGDTPLHLACKAPQVSCIDLLLDHGSRFDTPNLEGYRPIQSAVMSQHADVHAIDKLLEHDPSQVEVTDGEGNGLLHHAKGQKVIQCLVHHGVDTTKLNNKGQTALHKVVSEEGSTNPLDQLTALLLNGVPVDLLDSNGDTALHCLARLPAKKGSNREFMIKALVILGADLNQRNKSGMTVYDVAKKESCRSTMTVLAAVGADDRKYLDCKQYPPISQELLDEASSDKVPRKRVNWDKNNAAVLALDGGGIRGLVLVQMLLDLERRSNLQITQLFDWIGGTSTGSMLTLGMIYADMGLRDVQQLYFSLKDEIFQGSRPYNTEILENFMKTKFSESGVMSSRQFPRCVVPATIADCRPCKLHVFKNYGFRSENDLPPPHLQKIWEATRGSSAAPTYFTPHKRFVDGGLMANNPTIAILTEMHECNQDPGKLGYSEAAAPVTFTEGLMRAVVGEDFSKREQDNNGVGYIESRPVQQGSELVKNVEQEPTKPYVVVSFGTGLAPEVFVKDYNVSKVEGPLGAGRFLLGVKEFAETLVEQCAATDGAVVMGAKAWCESIGSYYFRLQPQMSYNMKMDETDNKNLVECLWDVQCFIYQHKDQFAKMTDLLMSAF